MLKRRISRGWLVLFVFGLAAAIALASEVIVMPYYVMSPGEAVGVSNLVQVPSDKDYKAKGDFLLTTVQVAPAHPLDFVWQYLQSDEKILKDKELLGNSTPADYQQESTQMMDQSKLIATFVALRRAGIDAHFQGDGAEIATVAKDTPSWGKLHAGETVTAINGQPISLNTDLTRIVRAAPVGTELRFGVTAKDGVKRDEKIVTALRPETQKDSYVGIAVQTKNARIVGPFSADFRSTRIGGPSAGLAFTLTMLDRLTPGELTGGKKVAVTGTIGPDGSVGPVGGIQQKTAAVKRTSAKIFLVPPEEFADAKRYAGSQLHVVSVKTLDEAIAAMKANGGDVSGIPQVGMSYDAQ